MSLEKLPLGNPDNIRTGKNTLDVSPHSNSDPGPQSALGRKMAPFTDLPPSTDRGDIQNFWFPFSRARKRLMPGGWARQITVRDLPIATSIAGVNMRLIAGAIRELHWHQAGEWAIMLYGDARITAIDPEGRCFIDDVKEGDLWFFPAGFPHSIQGTGKDGCEFLLVFDDGNFSEDETFLITDWMIHTPSDILCKNFGLPEEAFKNLPQREKYIFEGKVTKTLEQDLKAATGPAGKVPSPFSYRLYDQKPNITTKGGEARIVDSRNFPISRAIAAAHVIIHQGGLRELHWHPNADEWLYFVKGKARLCLFTSSGRARTMDFEAGDIAYIPKAVGHYIENLGEGDLVFLETFCSETFSSVSLSDWMAHTPPELITAHTGISAEDLAKIPQKQVAILPL